jgi:Mg2+-importing ATPase
VSGELSALRDAALAAPDDVLRSLHTSAGGLSEAEAAGRRARYGLNRALDQKGPGTLKLLFARARNPLNLLLLGLTAVSLATGDVEAAIVIVAIVTASIVLGFVKELRSRRAADALQAMVHTTATVVRSGAAVAASHAGESGEPAGAPPGSTLIEVPIHLLVPGDIIRLSAGDMIPADARVLRAKELFVNEAALTGESLPVEKHAAAPPLPADPLRLSNICYMGTDVLSGAGEAVVVNTGRRAYFGGIAEAIAGDRESTAFDRGIAQFAGLMIRLILVLAPLVFVINGVTKGNWLEALLFAIAVAVGLTPEMLPMVVTANLAKGALAMSRLSVIVKRLDSIQNLGAMDVLCTDKTGTLTQDRVIVRKHVDLAGRESLKVLEYAYLNSYFQSGLKNLLDKAVLEDAVHRAGIHIADAYREIDEIPFDFTRRRMSVVVEGEGAQLLICKGAVDEMYAVSSTGESDGTRFPLDDTHRQELQRVSDALNADGFRIIAIGYKVIAAPRPAFGVEDERDLTLLGYIAFLDPPKDSAAPALRALAQKGVDVKILTGDNPVITRKVCREVHLDPGRIVEGPELDRLDDDALAGVAAATRVFARVSPLQKARIIRCLQRRDRVVGFLGDGINDGPALKQADVGISVDTAVDIAKESADIILLEKSLLVLAAGVVEGRRVFANILKYLRMSASSNFGNVFSLVGASAWLPFLPMAPIQLLTINLLYDLSQMAIPADHVDADELARPRRWEIGSIRSFVLSIGPISSIFDYATFLMLFFVLLANTPAATSVFQTGWFVESLLTQVLIVHVIRTRRIPFVESRPSLAVTLATTAVCGIGVWLPHSPFAPLLGLTVPPPMYWPWLLAIVLSYLALTFALKRRLDRHAN